MKSTFFLSTLLLAVPTIAFQTPSSRSIISPKTLPSTTALAMSDDSVRRFDKASRSAGADENVIELVRPLGLILNNYENGDVYVETVSHAFEIIRVYIWIQQPKYSKHLVVQVAPNGNAARGGQVKEGDIVTKVSATFGDQMWSVRGVGLSRVMAAIRVRSGSTVKLAFESPNQSKKRKQVTAQQLQVREDAARAAQAKKDELLKELESDETKIKKPFFGLF
jgi:stringent starvation protein B